MDSPRSRSGSQNSHDSKVSPNLGDSKHSSPLGTDRDDGTGVDPYLRLPGDLSKLHSTRASSSSTVNVVSRVIGFDLPRDKSFAVQPGLQHSGTLSGELKKNSKSSRSELAQPESPTDEEYTYLNDPQSGHPSFSQSTRTSQDKALDLGLAKKSDTHSSIDVTSNPFSDLIFALHGNHTLLVLIDEIRLEINNMLHKTDNIRTATAKIMSDYYFELHAYKDQGKVTQKQLDQLKKNYIKRIKNELKTTNDEFKRLLINFATNLETYLCQRPEKIDDGLYSDGEDLSDDESVGQRQASHAPPIRYNAYARLKTFLSKNSELSVLVDDIAKQFTGEDDQIIKHKLLDAMHRYAVKLDTDKNSTILSQDFESPNTHNRTLLAYKLSANETKNAFLAETSKILHGKWPKVYKLVLIFALGVVGLYLGGLVFTAAIAAKGTAAVIATATTKAGCQVVGAGMGIGTGWYASGISFFKLDRKIDNFAERTLNHNQRKVL